MSRRRPRNSALPRSGITARGGHSSRASRAPARGETQAPRNSQLPSNRRLSRAEPPPAPPSGPGGGPPSSPGRMSRPRISSPGHKAADQLEPNKKPRRKTKAEAKRRLTFGPRLQAWMQRLSLVTGIIVVIAASVMVAWGLRRYLRSSPRFSVRTVQVEGNVRRTPHQIAKLAGIETGKNVFTVEEEIAEAAVEADPWIAEAGVRVDLPNQVIITVKEREAHALAALEGRLYLVDTEGHVFKTLEPGDPEDLPVVTGIDSEAIAADREAVAKRVRRALDLVSDLHQQKIAERYPVQEVNLDQDGSVTVVVGTDGISLVFGRPPFRQKVAKAERILQELRYRKVKQAVMFLDNEAHPERVVVRMK
ncbi:MAG: FtsQ-type POTRA domain-containing protein [Polyangiaceae bacterium]